jgi:GNAT superfamily N-acetyltransferase
VELIVGSLALARRLEASDARNAMLSAEAHGRIRPAAGALSIDVAGGAVAFAGVGSPLTHAIGVGMNGPVTAADLDRIEAFYNERGSQVNIDLCPLADPTLAELLGLRGYRCVEFGSVMVRQIALPMEFSDPRIERANEESAPLWSRTLAEGFFEHEPVQEELEIGLYLFYMAGSQAFLAREGDAAAAGGALSIHPDGLATLFADATLKQYRWHGLQSALIQIRLAEAASRGADMATATTLPGSVSHRNYERCGFHVAYTKMNMQREL